VEVEVTIAEVERIEFVGWTAFEVMSAAAVVVVVEEIEDFVTVAVEFAED